MKHFPILLVFLTFLSGCGDSRFGHQFELDETNFDAEVMQMIQEDARFVLPPGSRGLNFTYKPPIDPHWAARIELPTSARDMMVAQIEKFPTDKVEYHLTPQDGKKWWNERLGSAILDRELFTAPTVYRHFILTVEDGRLILYVGYEAI